MAIYRHVSGVIKEVPDNSAIGDLYDKSPSWKKIEPEDKDTKTGIYSTMSTADLRTLAAQRLIEVDKHHTKDEIIDRLEAKDGTTAQLKVVFMDNLINE